MPSGRQWLGAGWAPWTGGYHPPFQCIVGGGQQGRICCGPEGEHRIHRSKARWVGALTWARAGAQAGAQGRPVHCTPLVGRTSRKELPSGPHSARPPAVGYGCVCTTGTVRHKAEVQSKSQREKLFSDMSWAPFAAVDEPVQNMQSESTASKSYELNPGRMTYHRVQRPPSPGGLPSPPVGRPPPPPREQPVNRSMEQSIASAPPPPPPQANTTCTQATGHSVDHVCEGPPFHSLQHSQRASKHQTSVNRFVCEPRMPPRTIPWRVGPYDTPIATIFLYFWSRPR